MKLKPAQAAAAGAIALAGVFGIGAITAASASDDDGTTPSVEEDSGDQVENRDDAPGTPSGDDAAEKDGNCEGKDHGSGRGPGSQGGERPERPSGDSDDSERPAPPSDDSADDADDADDSERPQRPERPSNDDDADSPDDGES